MAFKMTPQGKKKCPYSKLTNKGLLNSPMKQKSTDELNAEAKIIAQGQDWQTDEEGRKYRSAETEDTVKGSSNPNEPKMSNEDWIKFKVDYEKKHGKPWEKPGSTNTGSYIEYKDDDIPEETEVINEVTQEAKPTSDLIGTNVNTGGYWTYGPRGKTWVETQQRDATKDESKMSSENKHVIGSDTTDDVNLQDIVDEQARIKAENSERISGDETTVKQLSPTRQLMNKYMPKKSMAKQEVKGTVPGIEVTYNKSTQGSKLKSGSYKSPDGKKTTTTYDETSDPNVYTSMAKQEVKYDDEGYAINSNDVAVDESQKGVEVRYFKSVEDAGWKDQTAEKEGTTPHVRVSQEK